MLLTHNIIHNTHTVVLGNYAMTSTQIYLPWYKLRHNDYLFFSIIRIVLKLL